jgi:hypothetical protein
VGTDSKLLPIPLSAGIDQSMDEFAAPPGTIRRSINTRVRQGGSLEQRRGVHGFAVSTPSYMANFQATGSVEVVGGVGKAAFFGARGRAFWHGREQQLAWYAGAYSEYVPLRRRTAFLTEDRQGMFGARQVVFAKDTSGRSYKVIVAARTDVFDVRIINSLGVTVSAFQWPAVSCDFVAAFRADPHVSIMYTDPNQVRIMTITLGLVPSIQEDDFSGAGGPFVNSAAEIVEPVPSGASWAMIAMNSTSIGVRYQVPFDGSIGLNTLNAVSGAVPSGGTVQSRPGFAHGKSHQYALLAWAEKKSGSPQETGPVRFTLNRVSGARSNALTPIATGILAQYAGAPFSAPIIAPTEDPNVFIWAASNGRTTFGRFEVVPSGTPRVSQDASIRGVAMSYFDRDGAIWLMDNGGEPSPVPKAGRTLLVKYPDPITQGSGAQRPLVQLATERQFPDPDNAQMFWSPLQFNYSRVAHGDTDRSVLLPVQLRSQQSGLFELGLYEYQHSSQYAARDHTGRADGALLAGQPIEIFKALNRTGIAGSAVFPVHTLIAHLTAATLMAKPLLASEVGFATEPYIATLAQASGVRITPGTRLYSAIFEWLAPSGERHRSRPATPRSFVNTVPAGVMPYVPEEFLSQRFPSPRVHYYRTVDGQKQFLRISPDTGVEPGTQFFDHNSDDDIRDNEVLYTDGGVQPNDLAPSCRFMALGEDRLWLGGLFESDIIQCSKFFVPREPVQFSDLDSFKVRLPFPCTGLAYLDGSLVAFCESSTYLISGTGPNNQGVGGFTLRPIADNVGCVDHRSIVATSLGVFFQAKRGIQLLPRGFGSPEQIRNLNELMGEFGDGFTEVIGATTRDYSDEETVRFLLRNPSTNRRIVATYELGTSTWNYDVIKDENGNEVPLSAIGDGPEGVVYGAGSGTYRFMTELEGLAGTPYDSMGSTVNRFLSEVHLSKMSVFGPAGEGKAKAVTLRGFAPATGAQVSLSLVTDYGTQTHTFSGIGSGTFFRRVVPALQDSSEMQISATFSTGVGRKTGLKLLSLTLELDPKAGARRARQGEQE